MREIEFRGKRIDNGLWVYGSLILCGVSGKAYILPSGSEVNESKKVNHEGCLFLVTCEVEEETICQYTGLLDKNDKKIYEWDIVSAWSTGVKTIGEVKQRNDGMWFIYPPLWRFIPNSKGRDDVEIIGNIYDNPELLKEATL